MEVLQLGKGNVVNVKIIGAGSIGNHLAHACRRMNWNVSIFDIDPQALDRTQNLIYPSRYGSWDNCIKLLTTDVTRVEEYDLIIVGTPPDTHIPLALENIKYKPKALLIEKPLCAPDLKNLKKLYDVSNKSSTKIFIGYDHLLGNSFLNLVTLLRNKTIGNIQTIDVNFREHWGGIFKAHSWLSGPEESYLGYIKKGGGALCEHSHALSMWINLVDQLDLGDIIEVTANQRIYKKSQLNYDEISFLTLKTSKGFIGRVVQDVITQPVKKNALVVGDNGTIELKLATNDNFDRVSISENNKKNITKEFKKARPDDFLQEVKHVNKYISDEIPSSPSPISLDHGIKVMLVIEAAFRSVKDNKTVMLDVKSINKV